MHANQTARQSVNGPIDSDSNPDSYLSTDDLLGVDLGLSRAVHVGDSPGNVGEATEGSVFRALAVVGVEAVAHTGSAEDVVVLAWKLRNDVSKSEQTSCKSPKQGCCVVWMYVQAETPVAAKAIARIAKNCILKVGWLVGLLVGEEGSLKS